MLKNKKKIHKFLALTLVLALCFTFLFGAPHTASAGNPVTWLLDKTLGAMSSGVTQAAEAIVAVGLNLVRKISAVFLAAAMSTLDLMLSDQMYDQVFFSPTSRSAINTGWGLVRDFVNMFYILILLFLAIATILRVNRFSDKKLMLSVVASALLVNFSQAITFIFIDISNLAMNYFSQQLSTANGVSFSSALADIMNMSDLANGNAYFNQDGAIIAAFAEIVFTAILAITLFVLAIALIIRLIAFWVLIVLSPLAFFGLALPGTSLANLWRSWFSKLTSYAFFGPVLLFFLWLSFVLINALGESKEASTIPMINDSPVAAGDGADGFVINFFKNTIPYVAAIYMLFYGFSLSRDIAAKAGNAVGSVFDKGKGWMTKGGRYAAIAGTGAAGLAAYGAYKGAGYGAAYGGAKLDKLADSDSKYRLLTKKGRKNAMDEKKAEWKGAGNEDYERGKANEKYNEMKKEGLTKDEVLKNIDSKNNYSAAGAAKLAAEKGWLSDQETYNKAYAKANEVKGMGVQFENNAKKKNLSSVINYQVSQKPDEKGEIIKNALEGKGVADFAEQDMEFFKNEDVWNHLAEKYSSASDEVRTAARKKASDKISDPAKLDAMMEIIG